MENLYLKEINARDIVDLKLVYESTKNLQKQLFKMRSILEEQYVPLKKHHQLQFHLGILSPRNKARLLEIEKKLYTINSNLWNNSLLTIDSLPLIYIKIYYNFNDKTVNTNLIKHDSSIPLINNFIDMVYTIKLDFDLFFTSYEYINGIPDKNFSVFWKIFNSYLPFLSYFLAYVDEEDLNDHFEKVLPLVKNQTQ